MDKNGMIVMRIENDIFRFFEGKPDYYQDRLKEMVANILKNKGSKDSLYINEECQIEFESMSNGDLSYALQALNGDDNKEKHEFRRDIPVEQLDALEVAASFIAPTSLIDWNEGDRDYPNSKHDVTLKKTEDSIDITLTKGDASTRFHIEIDGGSPAIHISTDPGNDNDIHVYTSDKHVRVVSEQASRLVSGSPDMTVEAARSVNNDTMQSMK